VLEHLQKNQPERKPAEKQDEAEANKRATGSTVPLHLPAR
jgi:hypothetical protein